MSTSVDTITYSRAYVDKLQRRIKELEEQLESQRNLDRLYRKFVEPKPDRAPVPYYPNVRPWHGGMCACSQCNPPIYSGLHFV